MISKTAHPPRHADRLARTVPATPWARPGSWCTIEVARTAWGAALLIGPGTMLKRLGRVQANSRTIAVARVLGGRHLAQAALSGIRPTPAVLALGVWVDTAHASTVLAFVAADRACARVAITDAAVAFAWVAAGLRDLTKGRAPQPTRERRRDQLARSVLRHLPAARPLLAHASLRPPEA